MNAQRLREFLPAFGTETEPQEGHRLALAVSMLRGGQVIHDFHALDLRPVSVREPHRRLVMEEPDAGQRHCDPVLGAGRRDIGVAH